MSFTVTVLGCGGMFATKERAASGYLVQIEKVNLWLDAGAGTWRNLLGHIDYGDLSAAVLTHRHPDHTSDIFMALHARRYGQADPLPAIPLWAPQETLDRLTAFADIEEAFDLFPVEAGDKIELGGASISFHKMSHPGETVGVRIENDGAVFAYSADSGPDGDFAGLARDADLLICEATYQDDDGGWEGHLTAGQAAEVAARNGVRHLVLSHLPPNKDLGITLQQAHHDGEGMKMELASDGATYEVSR